MKHHKLTIRLNLITTLEGFAIALSQQDMNDKLCLKILVGIIPLENMYRENEDIKGILFSSLIVETMKLILMT